ncbi:replication endonuclease [Klebsiella oxytoca]|uniref:replication endonuclease n=1 Tax=Klebsiella oxytoca TaxID=571 RepID=UPI00301BF617
MTRGRYAPTPPPPFKVGGVDNTEYAYPWNYPRKAIGVDKTPAQDPRELAAEHEFWQRARHTLHPLPLFIRRRMMARVEKSHEKSGRHIADLTLRNIVRRELPHISGVMKRYSLSLNRHADQVDETPFADLDALYHNFPQLNALLARFNSLPDFSPEDVKLLAQDVAIYVRAVMAEVSGDAEDLSLNESARRMYNEAISIAAVFNVVVPGSHKRRRPIDEIAAAIRKILDDRFWNRRLLKYATRWREHLRISLGDVRRSVSPYCSKERVSIWRERRQRSREILGGLEIEDKETGERFSLLEQIDKSTSNPEKRRVELMTRIGGFEKAANEWGYVGSYFTITTPSKYHAYTAFGHRNGKWQGSSPRDAQKYLNTIWQQIRAELAREEIGVFGLRVAEPHHDGTPHWHGVLFTLPEHQNALRDVLQRYATREDAGELATKHGIHPRFDFGVIDPEKGSATGYIVKYISKNIDGYALDNEKCDETGRPLKETAQHATAWASTWGIRQFQFLTSVPVTVWRELRKMRDQEKADQINPLFAEIHRAADVGDWHMFVNLMGGPLAKRCDLPLRTYYEYKPEENSYGEFLRVIKGLSMPLISIPPVITRLREFRIVKKSSEGAERPDDCCSSFDLKGAPAPSGTCVNNCTEVEKQPDQEEPEQYEIGQMTREQRKRFTESVRNYKPDRQKSPADEFEEMAFALTLGDCSEAERERAETYMKVAEELRQRETETPARIPIAAPSADRIAILDDYAKSIGMELSQGQLSLLLRGEHLYTGGYVVSATINGEIRRRKDTSQDRKITEIWQHMKSRHNVDSGDIRYDPVGNYADMLKKADPEAWRILFGVRYA